MMYIAQKLCARFEDIMQAVLCGYYGYGNGGDEALLATLLQFLPEHISPVALSGNPAQTEAMHRIKACDRNDFLSVFKLLQQSQVFIWGGGSLIQDSTSALSPWYYCALMLTARLMGLKTIAWAQGIGPLHRPQTQWIARQTFRSCTAMSVRDAGSLDWISRWKCTATFAPDPVWALDAVSIQDLDTLPKSRVAIVLRSHPQLTAERLGNIIQALRVLHIETQAFIVLVPFQLSQDLMVAQTIHKQLPEISHIVRLTDPRQLKGVFQQVEMAIAMRLHGLIMAAAEGCQCFGISYDPKVQNLIQEIQCPGWELAQMPDDSETIAQQWIQQFKAGATLTLEQRQNLIQQAKKHHEPLS